MRAFEKLQIDVKELKDIETYFPQMIRYRLPKFQYTAREMKARDGLLCLCLCKQL
jgi:hypothetical protein